MAHADPSCILPRLSHAVARSFARPFTNTPLALLAPFVRHTWGWMCRQGGALYIDKSIVTIAHTKFLDNWARVSGPPCSLSSCPSATASLSYLKADTEALCPMRPFSHASDVFLLVVVLPVWRWSGLRGGLGTTWHRVIVWRTEKRACRCRARHTTHVSGGYAVVGVCRQLVHRETARYLLYVYVRHCSFYTCCRGGCSSRRTRRSPSRRACSTRMKRCDDGRVLVDLRAVHHQKDVVTSPPAQCRSLFPQPLPLSSADGRSLR